MQLLHPANALPGACIADKLWCTLHTVLYESTLCIYLRYHLRHVLLTCSDNKRTLHNYQLTAPVLQARYAVELTAAKQEAADAVQSLAAVRSELDVATAQVALKDEVIAMYRYVTVL
jgi:hypothetical protein